MMNLRVFVYCILIFDVIGVISRRGVLAPMDMELVSPLLEALEKEGIRMVDEIIS